MSRLNSTAGSGRLAVEPAVPDAKTVAKIMMCGSEDLKKAIVSCTRAENLRGFATSWWTNYGQEYACRGFSCKAAILTDTSERLATTPVFFSPRGTILEGGFQAPQHPPESATRKSPPHG